MPCSTSTKFLHDISCKLCIIYTVFHRATCAPNHIRFFVSLRWENCTSTMAVLRMKFCSYIFLTIHECIYYFGHNIIFTLPLLRPHINWGVQRQRGPTALHTFVTRKRFSFNHEGKIVVVKTNGFVIHIWTGDLKLGIFF
jgi:hypothetical protein